MRRLFRMLSRCSCLAVSLLMLTILSAQAVRSDTVTRQCVFSNAKGETELVSDGNPDTFWAPGALDPALRVTLPERGAGWLTIEWVGMPGGMISCIDQNGEMTGTEVRSSGVLCETFSLPADAVSVLIKPDEGCAVSEIRIWSSGNLPDEVQRWETGDPKCTIMVFAAHPGDEYACFGGLVHQYELTRGEPVRVVYVTGGSRRSQQEALEGLWETGIRTCPGFLGFSVSDGDSAGKILRAWGGKDALLNALVSEIRAHRPEVVVSHSTDGEGGDPTHVLVSAAMSYAVEMAADPEAFPESAARYGTWKVSKLYLSGTENAVVLDWDTEQPDGKTLSQLVTEAYGHYTKRYCTPENAARESYTLAVSGVGQDLVGNDLLENIRGSGTGVEVTPSPTLIAEASRTPGILFSPEPTAAATQPPEVATAFGGKLLEVLKLTGIGLGLIGLITLLQSVLYRMRRRK